VFPISLHEQKALMEIKVEIIKRETIKPSAPSPPHLRCFDLCLIDQLQPASFISLLLFYSNNTDHPPLPHVKSAEISHTLKASLSETLTRFYPLAGKVKDNVSIECSDDGADYLEVQVNCRLSDILEQPERKLLRRFLPEEIDSSCLLLVQASFFCCGGMAIGVRVSRRLADASTASMLIQAWAGTALGSGEAVLLPEFGVASRLPPRRELSATRSVNEKSAVTRRYVFDASKIATLKAKAASGSVPQPTRVEAVSALIWKCARTVSRPSKLVQIMNIRKRVVPPFPESSFGNLMCLFVAKTGDRETELRGLVIELRKGIEAFTENYASKFQGDEAFSVFGESYKEIDNLYAKSIHFIGFSSWCRFPLYEADFGWGKPTWVTVGDLVHKNFIVLMDTRDGGGIEAWVTLSEEDMALFECDKELLEFASLNPRVKN
jgi:hypothetical protein